VAAGGVAVAALGSSAAFIVHQFQSVTVADLLRATVAIGLLVMVPSGLVGWLKLRRRNLAIVLEGAGWALNDRLLLTRAMGALFTRRPARPRGSRVDRTDVAARLLLGRRAAQGDAPLRERPERSMGVLLALLAALLALWYWRTPLLAAWQALRGEPPAPAGEVQPAPQPAPKDAP
jgi:hypothetical protein